MDLFSIAGKVILDDGGVGTKLDGIMGKAKSTSSGFDDAFGKIKGAALKLGAALGIGLGFKEVFDEVSESQLALAQMDTALKSTGDASGMTKQQLIEFAEAQGKVTEYSKAQVEQGENLLLTFTNIGKSTFPDATVACENMATAMHMDLNSACLTVGKALQDPVKGVTSLQREGVRLTDSQKKAIEAMVKTGDVAGAQKIILGELDKEFGNSAEAAGTTFPGKLKILKDNLLEVGAGIMEKLMPPIENLVSSINTHMPEIQSTITNVINTVTPYIQPIIDDLEQIAGNLFPNFGDAAENAGSQVLDLVHNGLSLLKDGLDWLAEHGEVVRGVIIGLGAAFTAYKIAVVAVTIAQGLHTAAMVIGTTATGGLSAGLTVLSIATGGKAAADTAAIAAQTGLNIAMYACPLTWIIAAVLAAVAAIALLTIGTVALVKHFQESSIETQKFGSNVSGSTQKAVNSFNDLDKKADEDIKDLAWTGKTVTKQMADDIAKNIDGMAKQTIDGFNKQRDDSIKAIQQLADGANGISKSEMNTMIANVNNGYNNRIKSEQDAQKQIDQIYSNAAAQHRSTTQQENQQVAKLKDQMYKSGIQSLSKNQVEEKAIFENMKVNHTALSAQEAAEIVKNSKATTDKVIKDAKDKYSNTVAAIIRERDETHSISADEADKLIKAAQKQRDGSIKAAQDQHTKVVDEAKKQSGDLVSNVDWQNGQVKTKWQVMQSNWDTYWSGFAGDVKKGWDKFKTDSSKFWDDIKTGASKSWNDTKSGWNGFWDNFKKGASQKWDDFKKDWSKLWDDVKATLDKFNPFNWGKDLIDGLKNGLQSGEKDLTGTVDNIGAIIKKRLHFSVPDEGPLTDYESWMPDFMVGLANGISENTYKVRDAVNNVAAGMSLNLKPPVSMPKLSLPGAYDSASEMGLPTDNSKKYEIHIHGDVNLADKGTKNATLQQLQFLAPA